MAVTDSARAALVTGGSRGIGLAVAATVLAHGDAVTLVARDPERLERAAAELRGVHGGTVATCAADLTEPGAPARAVDAHLAAHGRLDVVIANAGKGWVGSLAEMRDSDLSRILPVNVVAPFDLVRAALPHLRAAGAEHGNALVVLLASILGIRPAAGFAAYAASKAALVSLARSTTLEEAHHGIRATAICPAFVATDMTETYQDVTHAEMLPASDVAAAVRFLLDLSPAAAVPEIVIGRRAAGPYVP
jgi:NAD(P)-dependent dehydrogenase (short-subunit alcohol dehydrogenase family)